MGKVRLLDFFEVGLWFVSVLDYRLLFDYYCLYEFRRVIFDKTNLVEKLELFLDLGLWLIVMIGFGLGVCGWF